MSNKTPSQQKYFDELYELYHFNPFHDKMGRFSSSSRSAASYVSNRGRLTDKAYRRLKTTSYESDDAVRIRVDETGRVHPADQNKAISQIESQISKDWSNKSKVLNDTSKLMNDLSRFREKNRDRTAKAKAASEDLSNMSNEDFKKYIDARTERMNLERRYRDIRESDYNRGRAKLDDFLETAGTVLALGATAAGIAATIHTLRS